MMILHVPLQSVLFPLALMAAVLVPRTYAQDAESLSARFREAARAIQPSVVSVEGTSQILAPSVVPPTRIRVPGVDITTPGILGPPGAVRTEFQSGSGLVLNAEKGLILTADHVVGNSEGLVVTLPDGEKRPVTSVVRDPESDLALLAIDPAGLQPAAWGDSDALDLGDWVLTVGSPFGLQGSISAGIVSGKARSIHERRFEDLIQTDASVYPGSSGGPLVNLKGEVVGLVLAFQGDREPSFAIPARRARRVAEDLAEFGHVRRAYLGVRLPGDETKNRSGVLVSAVEPGTPASEAGLKAGDLILKVGDREVSTPGEIRSVVEFAEVGKPLSLSVRRDDETLSISFQPAERPGRHVPAEPDFIRPRELDRIPQRVVPR